MLPPAQQHPVHIDTLPFVTLSTVPMDSLNTNNFSVAVLGRIDDPRFGKSKAGFAAQFEPIAYNYDFPVGKDSITFDSVFLILKFSGAFGDDDKTSMPIEIYELTTALGDSTTYYGASRTNNVISSLYSPTQINTGGAFTVEVADSIVRIPLNQTLLDKLHSTLSLATKAEFLDVFKGLYVTVADGADGGIKYCSPVITSTTYSVSSAMWVYYHYPSGDSTLTGTFPYLIYSHDPRFGVFEHDDSYPTSSNVFLQGLCGTGIEARFDVDTIKQWKGEKSINRVELVLDIADADKSNPLSLNLFPLQLYGLHFTDHGYSFIRDVTIGVSGGAINRSLMQYSLNITHFFSDVSNGKYEALYIVPTTATSAMSYGAIKNNATLRITYGE
ncbi:hypothetical protein FACS189467_5850 [Bacteroidia bacterium]|nr:hypothetical protein FACS189467_5850 [Bacteroidia bacterium]